MTLTIITIDVINDIRYHYSMIESFKDKITLSIALRRPVRSLSREIQQAAFERLEILEVVTSLDELRIPPSNRLEKLGGDRVGQWSIRVNRQWRICFLWRDGAVWDAELVDYH